MKWISVFLIAVLWFATVPVPASSQVDGIGHSTRKELADLRQIGQPYESLVAGPYRVDWRQVLVYRFDLDGDGKNEAILRFVSPSICGSSSCTMLVVKWSEGRAMVVSMIDDGELWMLPTSTNGWRDLRGHYYDYKWDGHHYEAICRPDGVCENG